MTGYTSILILLIISIILACIIVVGSYIIALQKLDPEKISVFECGFTEFSDSRTTFEIRFFRVAILFIIMDLEIMYLFPWTSNFLDNNSFWAMIIFLFILTIGLVYEWIRKGLDW